MSSTISTELRDYQRQVKAKIAELRQSTFWHGFDQVERDLGLDNLVDDVEVVVRVTVPAADAAAAQDQVRERLSSIYLPSGWSADVGA